MLRQLRLGTLAVGISMLFVAGSQAADLEKIAKLLPDDTEMVMAVNIRQILDSAVVKKYGLEKLKDALDSQGDVKEYLKDMGLDPFKDIDSIIVGSSGNGESEKHLAMVTGRFDPAKLEAKAKEIAKDRSEMIKVDKIGKHTVFEISVPNSPQSMFACAVSKNLILAASSKASLEEGLEKHAGTKTTKLKNKQLQEVVSKMDEKQSLWFVVPASSFPAELLNGNEDAKKIVDNIEVVTAGMTLSDKLVIQAGIITKDAESAKSLQKKLKQWINMAQGFLALNDQTAPIAEAIGKIKTTANDKTISLEGELSAEVLEQLFKLADQ